jgi:hypothetical protein
MLRLPTSMQWYWNWSVYQVGCVYYVIASLLCTIKMFLTTLATVLLSCNVFTTFMIRHSWPFEGAQEITPCYLPLHVKISWDFLNKYSRQENNLNYERHHMHIQRCTVNKTYHIKSIISVNLLIIPGVTFVLDTNEILSRYCTHVFVNLRFASTWLLKRTAAPCIRATLYPFVEGYCCLLPRMFFRRCTTPSRTRRLQFAFV